MSEARAKKIKLILFDVDGVLTDGTIWVLPAPAGIEQPTQREAEKHADASGFAIISHRHLEAKGFHAHDGIAISLARLGGLQTGLITKRISETVALRARDLRMDYVYQGVSHKITALDEIRQKAGLQEEQVAYVGDDIIDLGVMRRCGLAISVPNGREEVKAEAHYVTEHRGGEGAARDAVEYILRAQGTLSDVREKYIDGVRAAVEQTDRSLE